MAKLCMTVRPPQYPSRARKPSKVLLAFSGALRNLREVNSEQDSASMNISQNKVSEIVGRQVLRASSSLNLFALELSGDRALVLEAKMDGTDAVIEPSIVSAAEMPLSKEAVCAVDWSWIYGSTISQVAAGEEQVRITFVPQGPVTVSVAVWQGKPFLSFMPYKAPAR